MFFCGVCYSKSLSAVEAKKLVIAPFCAGREYPINLFLSFVRTFFLRVRTYCSERNQAEQCDESHKAKDEKSRCPTFLRSPIHRYTSFISILSYFTTLSVSCQDAKCL